MSRPPRALWIACAILPGVLVQLVSCSEDPAPVAAVDDASTDTKQRPPPGEPDADLDASDAAPKKPPPVLPGCVGTSVPLVPSGERGYVNTNMGGDGGADAAPAVLGHFLLDFGANSSTIDLNAFEPPGPPIATSCNGDAAAPGAYCFFKDFDFFGPWGTVGLTTADYSFLFNSVKQAGIIGTDFLSIYPFTIEYTNQKVWKSAGGFCTDAQLLGAGFAPIPASGFYTNNTNNLRPLSDVIKDPDAAATANFVVPNVPTIPITVAGVSALAQLDTGYDDRITRHSINVNEAFLQQLLAKDATKLKRTKGKDLFLTTCVPGLSQLGAAWVLEAGTEVNFVGQGGAVARHDTGTILFVKEKLAAAERCGGIETWTVPAAQMGASFLVDAQAVIFDPLSSRVWIPKD